MDEDPELLQAQALEALAKLTAKGSAAGKGPATTATTAATAAAGPSSAAGPSNRKRAGSSSSSSSSGSSSVEGLGPADCVLRVFVLSPDGQQVATSSRRGGSSREGGRGGRSDTRGSYAGPARKKRSRSKKRDPEFDYPGLKPDEELEGDDEDEEDEGAGQGGQGGRLLLVHASLLSRASPTFAVSIGDAMDEEAQPKPGGGAEVDVELSCEAGGWVPSCQHTTLWPNARATTSEGSRSACDSADRAQRDRLLTDFPALRCV